MDTQTLIRLIIGLLMTAIVLVFAAKRVLWLAKLVTAGQPVGEESGRTDHMGEAYRHPGQRGVRANSHAALVDPWTGPLLHHVGLLHPHHGLYRGVRGAFRPQVPYSGRRSLGGSGLPAGLHRPRSTARHHHFRDHPATHRTKGTWPVLTVLRIPHRGRLADPLHDLPGHLHLRLLPRRRGEHGQLPIRMGCILLAWHESLAQAAGSHRQ